MRVEGGMMRFSVRNGHMRLHFFIGRSRVSFDSTFNLIHYQFRVMAIRKISSFVEYQIIVDYYNFF